MITVCEVLWGTCTIAAGVKVSIGVVHKTLADAKTITQPSK
jgi:hypothetical protein